MSHTACRSFDPDKSYESLAYKHAHARTHVEISLTDYHPHQKAPTPFYVFASPPSAADGRRSPPARRDNGHPGVRHLITYSVELLKRLTAIE
ncbi:hypothetical protein EVAR_12933_1 [Eumeta japonica]|uniref:Uncharacterized protein n=1 Tax=Eumeta variegata TaxID=151549 RepID=A0A4C1TVX5_EUMVA|nr:hypothetical protein EVAR_12933_1 [Eumeta japonica]